MFFSVFHHWKFFLGGRIYEHANKVHFEGLSIVSVSALETKQSSIIHINESKSDLFIIYFHGLIPESLHPTGPTVPGDGVTSSCSVRGPQSREHPGQRARGGGSLEGSAGRLRRPQGAVGWHGWEVPLFHLGERPVGLDGEHHPADRDSGDTQVSTACKGSMIYTVSSSLFGLTY